MSQQEFDFTARPEPPTSAPPKASPPKPEATREVLEKIKKLLRLGQSSQPHEAAQAMRRAFELAQKHGVDVASLDLDERTERLVHEYFKTGERLSLLRLRVLELVQTFFPVNLVLSRGHAVFIGRESDVAIAGYVLDFLVWAGSRGLRDYCAEEKAHRRKMTPRKRAGFTEGYIYGVAKQLTATKAQWQLSDSHAALVVAEAAARDRHQAEIFPNTVERKAKKTETNQNALDAGYRHGRSTQINQPLAGGERERLALE